MSTSTETKTGARYVRVKAVAERYDISIPTVWRWVREGRLPAPHSLSAGCTRWSVDELDAFDAERADKLTPTA